MGSTLRRTLALTTTITLLASLWVVTAAAPAAAQLTCGGELVTIPGTPGDDDGVSAPVITGTPGDDVIHGLGGNDIIDGLGGDDIICGGGGEDFIVGGDGEDLIFGGPRKDRIAGNDGDDDICGDAGPDIINGGADSDSIAGGPGRDTILGAGDDDFLWGYRNGLCTKRGRDVRDIIRGGPGGDTIRGGPGGDILNGNGGPDFIRGNKGRNRIDGGPSFDDCAQGPTIRRCERADLKVRVVCPESSPENTEFICKVRVRNLGPSATTYLLDLGDDESRGGNSASCSNAGHGDFEQAALRPNRTRTRNLPSECEILSKPSSVWMRAIVYPDARDPRKRNNKHLDKVNITD